MANSKFLTYDPGKLARWYAQEPGVTIGLPYAYVHRWDITDEKAHEKPFDVTVNRNPFTIQRDRPQGWDEVVDRAWAALRAEGHDFDRSEALVRVTGFGLDPVTLSFQRAEYNDQRRSNLILDFQAPGLPTLREMLRAEFGTRLPPLNDVRLANTLGVAALVLTPQDGRVAAYLVKRAKKGVAVFQDTWSCTGSGAAKWPMDDRETFFYHDGLVNDMYEELEEEIGLTQADLTFMMPVAFARELARGGKPQLFFLAGTQLPIADLRSRRIQARRLSAARHQPQEVEADSFFRSAARFVDLSGDETMFYSPDLSHEATALLVEARRQLTYLRRHFGMVQRP